MDKKGVVLLWGSCVPCHRLYFFFFLQDHQLIDEPPLDGVSYSLPIWLAIIIFNLHIDSLHYSTPNLSLPHQAFRQKQLLKRHQNLYHNPEYIPPMPREKTQECPECGKAFRHKGIESDILVIILAILVKSFVIIVIYNLLMIFFQVT